MTSSLTPVPEDCPELSSQWDLHQHVDVLLVLECLEQPAKYRVDFLIVSPNFSSTLCQRNYLETTFSENSTGWRWNGKYGELNGHFWCDTHVPYFSSENCIYFKIIYLTKLFQIGPFSTAPDHPLSCSKASVLLYIFLLNLSCDLERNVF